MIHMHDEIKKFWEDQGYQIKSSQDIYCDIDGLGPGTNELFYAWTDETHYFLIADISNYNSWYYYEWGRYSEEEMLKLIRNSNASRN